MTGEAVVAGGKVTQAYGHNGHRGIDLAGSPGAAVHATHPGTVVRADYDANIPSFGWHVRIQAGGVTFIYGHMMPGSLLVKVGQHVDKGTQLGREGQSGTATGYHVHYEVRENGKVVDPNPYLSGGKQADMAKGIGTGIGAVIGAWGGGPVGAQIGGTVGGIGGSVVSGAGNALAGLDAIGSFFGTLGERATWIRVLQVAGGAALVTAGVVIVGKGVIADIAVSALPGGDVLKAAAGK